MHATRISILGALSISLLLVSACDDKKEDAKTEAKADAKDADKKDEPKPDAKADAKPEEGNADAKPAEAGADGAEAAAAMPKVGVSVCDEYLEKYGKCIQEHAPDNMKAQMQDALAKSAERFKKQSEGPEKDSLQQACQAALDAVKKTSKGWGCTYE